MSVPFIYFPFPLEKTVTLDEDASRHLVQVLRMQKDAAVLLTDGKGTKAHGFIKDDHRKKTVLEIVQVEKVVPRIKQISIAISLVKNTARFEWFLEKATELGVSSIIPLLCERTEKEKFRFDRLKGIIVSAMLQSQQVWLPELIAPVDFKSFINSSQQYQRKYIAHCLLGDKKEINTRQGIVPASLMLIGPEGDFSPAEISLAIENGFDAVSLGNTRLRTETAGMVAAVLLVN